MAASRPQPSFRHEGHVFFIYDHRVKKEEDDPSDAILYFYPASVSTEQQIGIVGGIIGITDFCLEFLPQSMPTVVKLSGHNFALLQHEEFIVGLAGSPEIPDSFLIRHMHFVWSTFMLYQGSLGAIRERVGEENFVKELNRIWDMYLPLCQIHSDPLSLAFKVLPYVHLHKSQGSLYLHASHILQRTLRYKGVVAGALFSWKKVLCTQLSNGLTRQLLLLMTQTQFPCVEVNSVLELPGGVRLLHVFIPDKEYKNLTHRRKKVFNSPFVPLLTAPNLNWTNQQPYPFQNTEVQSEETVFNSFMQTKASSSPDKRSRAKTEVYSPISENALQANKNRWSYLAKDPSMSVSAGGGVTSGTDSEVFVDTLTETSFDNTEVHVLSKEKQKASHQVKGSPFNLGQSRSSELFISPSRYASSSEPNTPEQRDLVVYAEVHNDPTSSMDERVTPDSLTQAKTLQDSDDLLVFGQTTENSKEESSNVSLAKESFSSISNLRTDKTSSSDNNNLNVVETIVDFIHPFSGQGQNKSKIVSKTVVPNGVMSSYSTCNVNAGLNISSETMESKKMACSISSTNQSQNNFDAIYSMQQLAPEQIHDDAQPSHAISKNCLDYTSLDTISKAKQACHERDDTSSFIDVSDHDVVSEKFFTENSSADREVIEPSQQGNIELVSTAEKLGINETYLSSVTNVSSYETNQPADALEIKNEKNTDFQLPSNSSSGIEDSQHVQFQSQNQDAAGENEIEVSMRTKTDLSKENDSHRKELVSQGKDDVYSRLFQGSMSQSEEDTGLQEVLASSKQEIEASLEVRLSGEDSSALSSAEQPHGHSMDGSTLSLATADLGTSKMRLTFEASESDNSDTGIMSPLSERGLARGTCLSPVEELKPDNTSKKNLQGGDEDYTMRRLSSDFESRHVRGESRSSQGDKSADSLNSPSWETTDLRTGEVASDQIEAKSSPAKIKFHRMTLYAQGHSDTLLLLLLSKNASCSKSYINSLWKTCLSHLAELDFEVKDAERHMKDESENIGAAYQYMRYDSFSQSLKGSALLPVSSLANEMVDTCVNMHDAFETMPDVQDITCRSHSACCFGHRAINTETYFQLGQPRNAAGICAQNDRTFSLEQLAGRILQNDVKISIL